MRTTDSYLITCKGCGNNLSIETVDKGLISSIVESKKKDKRLVVNRLPEDTKPVVSYCKCTPLERFKLVMNCKGKAVLIDDVIIALDVKHGKSSNAYFAPFGYQIVCVSVNNKALSTTTICFKEQEYY